MVYVIDAQGHLIDDIHTRSLLLAPPVLTVSNLMDNQFIALKATDDQEAAVKVFEQERRTALPVPDSAGVLIGIVTIDDVLCVVEAAATEDIQKSAAPLPLVNPTSRSALHRMVQKRAGWLVVLFLGEMFTATAMGFFEKEIEKAVVLALFILLIISSGGNAGSQASTLVIRALALGEIGLRDWWRVIRREDLHQPGVGIDFRSNRVFPGQSVVFLCRPLWASLVPRSTHCGIVVDWRGDVGSSYRVLTTVSFETFGLHLRCPQLRL